MKETQFNENKLAVCGKDIHMKNAHEMYDSGTVQNGSVYEIKDSKGQAVMTGYSVYPGIMIMYMDIHRPELSCEAKPMPDVFAINHCETGRIECNFKNGEYLYMGEGDMSVGWRRCSAYCHTSVFPLAHYHGVTLLLNLPQAQETMDRQLGVGVIDLEAMSRRLCDRRDFGMIMKEDASLKHLFYELYHVPESIKEQYFRIKVLEILLFLSTIKKVPAEKRESFTLQQVNVMKDIRKEITENMMKKFTIEQLAKEHGIAPTTLKKCFKGVYGCTVSQYIKEYRMAKAKQMLLQTDDSIMEIANCVGYENSSKFAVAFHKITGQLPGEFRRSY